MRNSAHFGAPTILLTALRVIVAAGSLVACQPQSEEQSGQHAAVDTVAVRAAIDTLRSAYEDAVATGNFESMATGLAEGAVMVPPGGAQWDSLFVASELPFPPGATIDITPIEVRVLSADWAYEFGNSTVTYTPEGEDEARVLNDTYLVLFHNTNDGWKLYREVASSNLPPQP
jgi:ketosteroid isomerase-like protein